MQQSRRWRGRHGPWPHAGNGRCGSSAPSSLSVLAVVIRSGVRFFDTPERLPCRLREVEIHGNLGMTSRRSAAFSSCLSSCSGLSLGVVWQLAMFTLTMIA